MGQSLRQAKGLSQLPRARVSISWLRIASPSSPPCTNVLPGTNAPRLWQAQACAVITRRIYSPKMSSVMGKGLAMAIQPQLYTVADFERFLTLPEHRPFL